VTRTTPDIVCLSANHWTGLPTSKQHLMSVLAKTTRVLYVEPPIDVFSALGRPRRWAKFRGLRGLQDDLFVLSPLVFSTRRTPAARVEYHEGQAPKVARALRSLRIESPLVWAFAPEHVGYAGRLGERLFVYHAADEPAATSGDPEATSTIERGLIARADLIFVASQALLDVRAHTGKAHRLPNAADRRHFATVIAGDADAGLDAFAEALARPRIVPRELRGRQGPVVLFGGAAYGWFDSDIFLEIARARPDWRLIAVGPVKGPLAGAPLPGNVTLAGRKPYDTFPWYVAATDVAILPLREGQTATNCDPIILYEYLLCGKPVVATPFPAALERGALVETARSAGDFVRKIEEALREDGCSAARRARMSFGWSNTWEDRAEAALGLIRETLDGRGQSAGTGGAA